MNNYIKYPRTFHLPYSECITDDDKRLSSDEHFKQMKNIVVTEKMDGQNQTVYSDGYYHARSVDGNNKSWDKWFKQYIQKWCHDIPNGYRVCGECLFAKHSIEYSFPNDGYLFQMFAIYDDKNTCLSWEQTWMWCELFGLKPVNVIYYGKYDKDLIMFKFLEYKQKQNHEVEGFVVRNVDSFAYEDFSKNVAKYVRKNHVQTDEHWTKNWQPNKVDEWRNVNIGVK